jgi:biotin transport system substrate-specific component
MPFGIPITLQTFTITISAMLLGKRLAFLSCVIYILLGAIGLPVFSSYSGGMSIITGPTGGFILSFPLMAYIIGYFSSLTSKPLYTFTNILIAHLINLCLGSIFFGFVTGISISSAFYITYYPFIPVTLVKSVISTFIGLKLKSFAKISIKNRNNF